MWSMHLISTGLLAEKRLETRKKRTGQKCGFVETIIKGERTASDYVYLGKRT